MTDLSHYDKAKEALGRAEAGVVEDPVDLATGQLHAIHAVADELHHLHNLLLEIGRPTIYYTPPPPP